MARGNNKSTHTGKKGNKFDGQDLALIRDECARWLSTNDAINKMIEDRTKMPCRRDDAEELKYQRLSILINNMRKNNKKRRQRLEGMQVDIKNIRSDMKYLQGRITKLEISDQIQNKQIAKLAADGVAMDQKVGQLSSQLESLQLQSAEQKQKQQEERATEIRKRRAQLERELA